MSMIDIALRIFSALEDQRIDPTADLIDYKIDRDGSATLFFTDIFNANGYVMLSPSETNIWLGYKNAGLGYKNADRLIGYFPKITEDTPLEEIKEIHQAIWDRVVDNGLKPPTPYRFDCAACEYVVEKYRTLEGCYSRCPIAWHCQATEYNCLCGIEYYNWMDTFNCKAAEIVRDIPFKFELKEKKDD